MAKDKKSDSEIIDELRIENEAVKKSNNELGEKISELNSEIDNLNSTANAEEILIDKLRISNSELNDQIDILNKKIISLEGRKTVEQNNEPLNPNELTVGMTVTPTENHLHFEKGYNARVESISTDKEKMIISNLDNRTAHRNPTEVPTNLFRIIGIFVLMLFSSLMFSQSEQNTDQSNSILGLTSNQTGSIITILVGLLFRFIEKKLLKNRVASEIKQAVYGDKEIPNSVIDNVGGALNNIVTKLENGKSLKK